MEAYNRQKAFSRDLCVGSKTLRMEMVRRLRESDTQDGDGKGEGERVTLGIEDGKERERG